MSAHDDAATLAFDDTGHAISGAAVAEAAHMESVDGEVALLRLWLMQTTRETPRDLALMRRLSRDVVAAAAVKYRLSPKRADDLAAAVASVLDQVGGQLGMLAGDGPEEV